MKTPSVLKRLSFVPILFIAILPSASSDLIADTCNKTPFSDFCVSVLKADPHSSTADTPHLGLIMVDKVNAGANSTSKKVRDLISRTSDRKVKKGLRSCAEIYGNIIKYFVPSSVNAFKFGNYKFAQQYMNEAATDATHCEGEFQGVTSPISSENDYEHKVATVASAIAAQLL